MTYKSFLIGTGAAVVLVTTGSGVAFAHGLPGMDSSAPRAARAAIHQQLATIDHEAVKAALEAKDYDAFVAAHGEDSQIVNHITPERFEQMAQAFDENGGELSHKAMMGKGRGPMTDVDKEAIKAALEANDYDAFIAAHGENSNITEFMTEERFAHLVEQYAENEGELPIKEHKQKRGSERFSSEQFEAIKQAIEEKDYDAFVAAQEGNEHILSIVTEDNFDKFIDMHELRQSGDREGARAIAEELGLFQGTKR